VIPTWLIVQPACGDNCMKLGWSDNEELVDQLFPCAVSASLTAVRYSLALRLPCSGGAHGSGAEIVKSNVLRVDAHERAAVNL